MRIAKATIENFRQIQDLELDFTDSLGRVRDTSLIVGPNTSEKKTVLEALAICVGVGVGTELPFTRPNLRITPRTIVRKGALFARVTCEVRFSTEKIRASQRLFALSEKQVQVPQTDSVTVSWRYPSTQNRRLGDADYSPSWGGSLFKNRVMTARLLPTGRLATGDENRWRWFERSGGVFLFDQQRTGLWKTIRQDNSNIIRGEPSDGDSDDRRSSDTREILLTKAIESEIDPLNLNQPDEFKLITNRYAEICAPRKIIGARRDELGELDIFFLDGISNEYRYDDLSSGEQMLLLFLIKIVIDRLQGALWIWTTLIKAEFLTTTKGRSPRLYHRFSSSLINS